MKKTFKSILAVAGVLGLTFALNAVKSQNISAAEKLPAQTTKELKEKGTLTIGLEGTFAPYSYRKDGKLTGFEVELGKQLAKEMGLKAKFVPTKWDGLIAGLDTGKYDVVLNNVTITKERKEKYLFSKPYIYSHFALITKKDSDLTKLSHWVFLELHSTDLFQNQNYPLKVFSNSGVYSGVEINRISLIPANIRVESG